MNQKEEPVKRKLPVHYLRHGESAYQETGFDLTRKGMAQVLKTGIRLAEEIRATSPEQLIVWTSPHARTLSTTALLVELFKQKFNLTVNHQKRVPLLRDSVMDRSYLNHYLQKQTQENPAGDPWRAWHLHWRHGELPPSFEPPEHIFWRFGRVLYHLFQMAKKIPYGPLLPYHIILVAHQALPEKLFEKILGKDKPPCGLLEMGEMFSLEIDGQTSSSLVALRGKQYKVRFSVENGIYQKI